MPKNMEFIEAPIKEYMDTSSMSAELLKANQTAWQLHSTMFSYSSAMVDLFEVVFSDPKIKDFLNSGRKFDITVSNHLLQEVRY